LEVKVEQVKRALKNTCGLEDYSCYEVLKTVANNHRDIKTRADPYDPENVDEIPL